MSFSGTSVEHREHELKTVKAFLAYSLLGSLALHISLLIFGLGSLLVKAPEITEEPLEVTIVETPPEAEKKPPEKLVKAQPDVSEKSNILTSSDNQPDKASISSVNLTKAAPTTELQPSKSKIVFTKSSTVLKKQPYLLPSIPKATLSERKLEPQSSGKTANIPTIPKATLSERKLEPQPSGKTANIPNVISQLSSTSSMIVRTSSRSSVNSSKSMPGIRDIKVNQGVSQPSQNNGDGSNVANNSRVNNSKPSQNNGDGSNVANNSRVNNSKVATAPINTAPRTDSGNGNGRATCRDCNANYPEWARKRGIEGRVDVAVDTDEHGNVTNVRLLKSSGNDRLDAEHLSRARKWKLKGSSRGREGVIIGTEYAIKDSQRYRQLQERKKRREAEARNTETPRRRRRVLISTSDEIPNTSAESTSSSSSSTRPTRRHRREINPASVTSNGESNVTPTRHHRRIEQPTASSSDNTPQSSTRPTRRHRREINPASVTSNGESNVTPTRHHRQIEQPTSSSLDNTPQSSQSSNSSAN
jgi:TonB family protein